MTSPESQLESKRVYSGKVVSLDVDTVRFPDGTSGELEMIRHPGASAILPFLSDPDGGDPQILLIRQYRYAADGYVYEVPAGRLEAGEDPTDCARRELLEETGCRAESVKYLTTIFTTPGFTDEKIHLFMATGVTAGTARPESDEFVELQPRTISQALRMIQGGEIQDAKTIVTILYVAGFELG
ncbi:MAG: NUDIX hydrolase [Gemmatimonadaceae bacterium]|nr:NUDIX hydrolase [Gemmatimonadaceae bacterium]